MIGGAMYITISTLWNRYKNKTKIAEMTGHDWKTVAKAVKMTEQGIKYPERKPHPRILDPYKGQILEWIEKDGLSGVRINEELQRMGIKAGYSTVKDYISSIKSREDIFMRIHTKPGEEAQVDFGYVGLTPDNGKRRKTWVFNMRLSYSRKDYYEKVYNQRVETFIQCHINAFTYFKGVPEYVKIDNLKAAILQANFYEPVYQRLYLQLAEHYGFKAMPCRVNTPNDKGKVESGIKYVQNNFFAGRKFKDGRDVDIQLMEWTDKKCNERVHGTTRRIPKEVFNTEEKQRLRSLPLEDFKLLSVGTRKVYHDCHIYFEYNYYSVPFEYVGKEVEVEAGKDIIQIYYKGREVALHERQSGKGGFKTNISHYPQYKRVTETEYQEKYQAKMAGIGCYAEQIFFLILNKQPRDWGRTVQGIISLSGEYSKDIVNMACKRAIVFDVYQYNIIKNICKTGSYNLPLEYSGNIDKEEAKTYEYAEV